MATVSITKKYVIKDDAVCKKLIDAIETTPVKSQTKKTVQSSYERGTELLAMRYCR